MPSTSNLTTRAVVDAATTRVDAGAAAGVLRIYAGTVPADADTALGAQTLLSEHTMSDPAFGAAADANPGAIATAGAIADDTDANATGTATFGRIFDSNGLCVFQLSAGATGSGAEIILNSAAIQIHATVKVNSLTITHPDT